MTTLFQPRSVTTFRLTSDELDTLVNEYLKPKNLRFESVAYYAWNNDSNYSGSTRSFNAEQDATEVKDWVEGDRDWVPSVSTLLFVLSQMGVVPEGKYMIEVSW